MIKCICIRNILESNYWCTVFVDRVVDGNRLVDCNWDVPQMCCCRYVHGKKVMIVGEVERAI